jgi:hypothetical protein
MAHVKLRSFRDNLIDKLHSTVEEAQLLNGTINMEYDN